MAEERSNKKTKRDFCTTEVHSGSTHRAEGASTEGRRELGDTGNISLVPRQ